MGWFARIVYRPIPVPFYIVALLMMVTASAFDRSGEGPSMSVFLVILENPGEGLDPLLKEFPVNHEINMERVLVATSDPSVDTSHVAKVIPDGAAMVLRVREVGGRYPHEWFTALGWRRSTK